MVEAISGFLVYIGMALENVVGMFLISYATPLAYGALVAGSVAYGRAQQRRMENRAKDQYNSTITDRSVMIRSSSAPSPWAVGLSKLSGPIPFVTTTGPYQEYLHLVIALARHECDAIEAVYFNDYELPAENPSTGFVESGKYAWSVSNFASEYVTTNGSGVATLSQTASSVENVVLGGGQDATLVGGWSHSPPSNTVTGLAPSTSYTIGYSYTTITSLVRIRKHLGQPGQVADADLIAESGGEWTSSDKGTSVCYLYVRIQFNIDAFGSTGIPNVSARVRGSKLYDPRKDTTAGGSGSHRVNDPTTWEWSQNAALATAAYLRDQRFGIRSANSEVIASELITAANVCDEDVTLMSSGTVSVVNGSASVIFSDSANAKKFVRPGMILVTQLGAVRSRIKSIASNGVTAQLVSNYAGTTNASATFAVVQTRYLVDGALSSANSPWSNLEEILKSMAGSAVWCQGRWLVRAGAHEAPTMTIDENFFAGGAIEIVPRKGREDLYNGVEGRYVNRAAGFVADTYPAYTSSAYETEDGEQILTTIDYDLVVDATQCQRLGKISVLRSRQALTVRFSTNLRAYNLTPMGTVALTVARYGWSAKQFTVLDRKYGMGGTIEHVLQETSSTVWDWQFSEAAGVDPAPNTTLPDPVSKPAAPTNLAVDAGPSQLFKMSDGTVASRALVTWTASTDMFVRSGGRVDIDWKMADAAVWVSAGPIPGDSSSWYISPVPDPAVIVVRVRFVSSAGRASDYAHETEEVTGKSAAPSNVSGLSYSLVSEGVRISWNQPADLDWDATELRIGASWAAGALLFHGKATSHTWVNAAPGTYTVWAAHYDASGNVSATPQSVSITVLSLDGGSLVGHGNGMVIEGDTAYKTSSSGNWDGGVYTRQAGYGGARIRGVVGHGGLVFMFGLNTDPTTDANYTSIDFALYGSGNHYEIYESGSLILNTGVGQSAGDAVEVAYDGRSVKYLVNGAILYERGAQSNLVLYGDSSFYNVGTNYKLYGIEFQQVTTAPRGNLVNSDVWTIGTITVNPYPSSAVHGGSRFYLNETNSGENAIVMGEAPDGVLRPLWKCGPAVGGAGAGADGGFVVHNAIPTDEYKTYRSSVWVKVDGSAALDGSWHFGATEFGSSRVATISTGAADTNPYFHAKDRSALVPNRWYFVTGFVFPSNFGTTAPNPTAGAVYDGVTGERVASADKDFKWYAGNMIGGVRAYQYYATAGAIQYFWGPRFEMCDGSEPTVQQLMASALESKSIAYDNEFDAAYGLNGDFNRWPITSTYPTGWGLWANSGGLSKETVTVASGPNAIRMVTGGNDTGVYWTKSFASAARPIVGSYVEVTVAAYVVSSTSGANPQVLVRLYTNSGLSTYRDTTGAFSTAAVGWQNMTLNAAVASGETIYGIDIYLMGSWTGGVGAWTGTVVFDKVFAKVKQPKDMNQLTVNAVSLSTSSSTASISRTWPNSAAYWNPITGTDMDGAVDVVHGLRQRYLIEISVSLLFQSNNTTTFYTLVGSICMGRKNVTSGGNTAQVGQNHGFVRPVAYGITNNTRAGTFEITLVYVDDGTGMTVGSTYRYGIVLNGVGALDNAASLVAPGSSAAMTGEAYLRATTLRA